MINLGNISNDRTNLNFKFYTHKADGTPITLAGTPAVSCYKSNNTTESTAGLTLTVDFDSRTGMHNVEIDLDNAFYVPNEEYDIVLTAGTVDGVSVVGYVLAHFSIENRSDAALYPNGMVVFDATNGTAGAVPNVNGTILKPCNSLADAMDIVEALNLTGFYIKGTDNTVQLPAETWKGYVIQCENNETIIDLGSQNVTNLNVNNAHITGPGTTDTDEFLVLQDCMIRNISSLPRTKAYQCRLEQGITLGETGPYEFADCVDGRAGAEDLEIDFASGLGVNTVIMSNFSGFITFKNIKTGDVLRISGNGKITFDASCTAGTATVGPGFDIVDNSAGMTLNKLSTNASIQEILETAISETSAGRIAGNFDNFYDNADAQTTKKVDDIGNTVLIEGVDATDQIQAAAQAAITAEEPIAANTTLIEGADATDQIQAAAAAAITAAEPIDANTTQIEGVDATDQILAAAQAGAAAAITAAEPIDANTTQIEGADATDQIQAAAQAAITAEEPITANTTQIEGVDATDQIRDAILADATKFNGADIAAIKAKTDNLPFAIKKNTAISKFKFVMLDALTGDPKAGLGTSITATKSLDNNAFTSMGNTPTERGFGVYEIDVIASDTNGDTGAFRFTASGAEDTLITFITNP